VNYDLSFASLLCIEVLITIQSLANQQVLIFMNKNLVFSLDEGEAYLQPMPANGYVVIKLTPEITNNVNFAMGIQILPPGGVVREHFHQTQDEIIFCFSGQGKAIVNGQTHAFTVGTTVFLKQGDSHQFINDGDEDLKFTWTILPSGLEEFFRKIGKKYVVGSGEQHEIFSRPLQVKEIEEETGFG
jgi:quercetin dioxygenase-like cupin family protein